MIGNAHCVNPLSHALRRASSPERGSFLCGGKVCLLGSYPFRLLPLVAATFPKGTASVVAIKFPASPKGVPLGELASSKAR